MSDNKNAAVLAISAGSVILCSSGILSVIKLKRSCCAFSSPNVLIQSWYNGVQASATTIALTLTLSLIKAAAHSLVSPRIAPFAAAYADVFPCPVRAVLDEMFTIDPLFFFNSGSKVRMN